jgi:L-lactate dehydrogenase complex protein LldG
MSKTDILNSIRKHRPEFPPSSYPFTEQAPQPTAEEALELFKTSLKIAGAEIVELKEEEVDAYCASDWAGVLDFTLPEVRAKYPPSCPLDKLDKIEHALLEGNFGVAENGAIWLEDKNFPHRIVPFITQHLILKLDSSKIVATMREAYQQVQLEALGYGVFLSGPSKTADIEQSLVYGAHGAKELTVILTA